MTFALVRSKGAIIGDGNLLPMRALRNAIPAAPLLSLLIDAALSGNMRQIDSATGEEVAPARPIQAHEQVKIAQYLLDKRLPTPRAAETEDSAAIDLKDAPLTPEEIKRLPLSEITRIIEATYSVVTTPTE